MQGNLAIGAIEHGLRAARGPVVLGDAIRAFEAVGVSTTKAAELAGDVIDHPRASEVLAALGAVHRSGAYAFDLLPAARRVVESGRGDEVLCALDQLRAGGVTGPTTANDLVKVAHHRQFDEIVALAPAVHRSGSYGFQVIPTARDAVESGRAPQLVAASEALAGRGVTAPTLFGDLTKVANHPRFDEIVALAPTVERTGTYGFQVISGARAIVESGRSTDIVDAVDLLRGAGVTGPSLVADLAKVPSTVALDGIVELAPILDDIGSYSFELVGQAQRIAASGRSDEVIGLARLLSDHGVSRATAARSALELIGAGMSAADVERAVVVGGRFNGIDPLAQIVDRQALAGRSLGELSGALLATSNVDTHRHATLLTAMSHRLGETAPVDEVDRDLLASLRALVDQNVARTTGTLHDGYARYPDFADLGRIDAIVRLRATRADAAALAPGAAVASVAPTAATAPLAPALEAADPPGTITW